jgi:hypothetical protein
MKDIEERLKEAFEAGFSCSREGFNGECSYDHCSEDGRWAKHNMSALEWECHKFLNGDPDNFDEIEGGDGDVVNREIDREDFGADNDTEYDGRQDNPFDD